ncbi:MAG TPA: glycosyltransferase family 4 protein [Candidatus Paceibacterota bacterium]
MKIALIGAGVDSIPSKKFGAIEMILWNYKRDLERLGHEVVIFNTQNLKEVSTAINNGAFDFVELNYSEYVSFFSKHLEVPFCTVCHSGYITNRKKWSIGYTAVFYDTMKSPGIIALSEDIRQLYIRNGHSGFLRVVRNGIDTEHFTLQEKGNDRAICLGRIEPRKRQAWLANTVRDTVDLDFVGPIQDPTFKALARTQHKGYWMKDEVYKNLSQYSCLVLLSDGEAAPLVVPEALAAGLSIVVSKSAAANLDEQLPFITVLPDDTSDPEVIAQSINDQIKNNTLYRAEIVAYAKHYFDNKAVVSDFMKVVEEFRSVPRPMNNARVPFKEMPLYLLSKCALFVKSTLRSMRLLIGKTSAPAVQENAS